MTKIVSILNPKGGVGKTTIAIHIARALNLLKLKTCLIDSDPQGSSRDWHASGKGDLIPVIGFDRPTLDKDIKHINDYSWIIIDGAAKLENMLASAIKCSDCILIPIQPSPYDIWATEDLVDIIKTRQKVTNGKPKAAFIINRKIENSILGREISEILKDFGFPIFKSSIVQRQIYPRAGAKGSTALDENESGKASQEIKKLSKELMEFLK